MKPAEILREIKKLPRKLLGQNFLVDESVVRDMILASEIKPDEIVVEVGPGLGALTFELAKTAKQVLAIETDQDLVNYLRLTKLRNVKVIHGDALRIDWTVSLDSPYRIVANIPYSITFPLVRKIYGLERKPTVVVLLIQKEVAARLIAKPGTKERGLPTVRTEANANIKVIRTVKPGSFYPSPKVDSAIVRIELIPSRDAEVFWPAVEAGFAHKRQTLANSISKTLHLPKIVVASAIASSGLTEKARAEELTLDEWVELSKRIEQSAKLS